MPSPRLWVPPWTAAGEAVGRRAEVSRGELENTESQMKLKQIRPNENKSRQCAQCGKIIPQTSIFKPRLGPDESIFVNLGRPVRANFFHLCNEDCLREFLNARALKKARKNKIQAVLRSGRKAARITAD